MIVDGFGLFLVEFGQLFAAYDLYKGAHLPTKKYPSGNT
jgi:hypothetical protein